MTMSVSKPILELRGITKQFGDQPVAVLKDFSLSLMPGEFCVLLGSNGSGKSTLIEIISGGYSIDAGRIFLNGEDVTRKERSLFIAMVSQDIHQGSISELSILENWVLAHLRSLKPRLRLYSHYEQSVVQSLKDLNMGLEKFLHRPLSHLSGGQRQTIATWMILQSEPRILLLDEHTSALDPRTQKKLMHYTNAVVGNKKITTLMVTHRLEDALGYGKRLIVMHQGKIIFDVSGVEKQKLCLQDLLKLFHDEREF
jgi:putative tryptophan/tyrosine transport system ATP-binding protein